MICLWVLSILSLKESWRPGWMVVDVQIREATSITVKGRRQIKSARMKYWMLKHLFEFDLTLQRT
jgi:hypothetical protein